MWLSMRSDSEVAIWSLVLFRKSLYAHFVSLALLTNGKKKDIIPFYLCENLATLLAGKMLANFLRWVEIIHLEIRHNWVLKWNLQEFIDHLVKLRSRSINGFVFMGGPTNLLGSESSYKLG